MKRFIIGLSILFFVVLIGSCRPTVSIDQPESYAVFPTDSNLEVYDFPSIFQSLWSGMNHNYLFWDRDLTDWDAVYDYYKPRFDYLGRFTATSVYPSVWLNPDFQVAMGASIQWFEEMTKDMIDSHLRLILNDSLGVITANGSSFRPRITDPTFMPYTLICPPLDRFLAKNNGLEYSRGMLFRFSEWDNENTTGSGAAITKEYDFIQGTISNYLDDITYYHYDPLTDSSPYAGTLPRIVTGRINTSDGGYILYLYSAGYLFYTCQTELAFIDSNLGFNNVISKFFSDLKDPNLKGVVFDLRGVIGGDIRDTSYIMGRMVDSPFAIGYQRGKSGEGRLDYSPWVPVKIMPAPESERIRADKRGTIPIIALTDELTSSAAEYILMGIHAMPNGYVIGERSYGATSGPHYSQKFNGGLFDSAPYFASLTVSSLQTKHTDGNIYEGIGIPPTANGRGEQVSQDWTLFLNAAKASRRDNVLEKAITRIDSSRSF
jgi:hypothetical protein